jgi:hypothetical protein
MCEGVDHMATHLLPPSQNVLHIIIFIKLKFIKINQVYVWKISNLYTIKYIFMMYVLDIITIEIFVFIDGHALQNLSLTKKLYATHFRKEGIL